MFPLLFATAVAGPVVLPVTPDVSTQVLPQAVPGRIDILMRPVHPELRTPRGFPADGVRAARSMDLGGTAVITLWTVDPTARAWVKRGRYGLEVRIWPTGRKGSDEAPPTEIAPAPAGPGAADPGCGDNPVPVLVPLHGADMTSTFTASEFSLDLPSWQTAEPTGATWDRVSELRLELTDPNLHPADRTRFQYTLGALHRDLGYAREAAWYFGKAHLAGVPRGVALLQRAGALLQARDWEGARVTAVAAAREGASLVHALKIQGIAALFSDEFPGPAVGLALSALQPHPDAALVAGAVLLRSGCFVDATAPLRRSVEGNPPGSEMGKLLLADALLLAGDVAGAEDVLKELRSHDVPRRWAGPLRTRSRLAAMLRESPTTWPAMIPTLERQGRQWDEEGAEALFLLGQIGERLGDEPRALESYGALVDRWRSLARGEPGRRLHQAWSQRLSALLKTNRDTDALALHNAFWRRSLASWVVDTTPLAEVARAYARIGLHEQALDTLTTLADVEGQRGLDDRNTILEIAEAYRATGRLDEAMDTLDFLARRKPDPALEGRARMVRGRVLLEQGDSEAARAWFASVEGAPPLIAEAVLRIGLLDAAAGRCENAIKLLPATPSDLVSDPSPGVVLAARSQCLRALGKEDEGRGTAAAASTRLLDEGSASALGYVGGVPPKDGAADIWEKLARADAYWEELRARRGVTKKPSTPTPPAR
jgi:tetratricopeptide (TPR) repeat protein